VTQVQPSHCCGAGVPHEVVGDELPAPLEGVQQRHRPALADERCRTIHLDHEEPTAGGCDGVAFSRVRLLAHPQCVQLGLGGAAVDRRGSTKFTFHEVIHCFLHQAPRPSIKVRTQEWMR
jgi:hypothetical protein